MNCPHKKLENPKAMNETKKQILRKSMSKKYCGETRFDYLDDEELPMIFDAMQVFSDINTKPLHSEIDRLKAELEGVKNALTKLVDLKAHKDEHGKDMFYLQAQPDAWIDARNALYQTDKTE
jgi:hypothetical protein